LAPSVTVIDYGTVNLANIVRALEFVGANVKVSDCPKEVAKGSRIILPGVGAFGVGMKKLKEKRLDEVLQSICESKPLMGICLGMQMLLDRSAEFGEHEGLGIIAGDVVPIDSGHSPLNGRRLKIPNVGWRGLCVSDSNDRCQQSCLKQVEPHESVYFVHSYMVRPTYDAEVLATCEYGPNIIAAAVAKDNTVGLQFHPERSGPVGLKILETFIKI
jgi:glutamine amidotransferase